MDLEPLHYFAGGGPGVYRDRNSYLCGGADLCAGSRVFSGVFHLFLRAAISEVGVAALAATI